MDQLLHGARVLVTGGSGMIGSHVVEGLLAGGAERVVVLDKAIHEQNLARVLGNARVQALAVDICDSGRMRKLVPETDVVIHLAALLMLTARENPRLAFAVNTVASHELLQMAVELGVKRFVFGSSVAVYGSPPADQVITEEAPFYSRSFYGAAKAGTELYCRAFADMYGLSSMSLRFGTVYGPRQHPFGLFPRYLLSILDQVDRGEVPEVEGDPGEVHDFVYAGDVADCVVRAAASRADGCVNVVSGTPVTLEEVYGTLLDLYGAPREIRWRSRAVHYVTHRRFSGDLADRLLGFKARTPLAEGLRRFLAWRGARAAGVN